MSTKAKQGSLEAMLEVARRNIGFIEGRNNANPYAKVAGHANYQPWCATFLAAVARRAGVKIPSESAYTPTMSNGFKAQGLWHSKGQVGDFVFFHWPSMGRIAHVGLVEVVRSDGYYVCIEGNTDSAGGRTGGRVMRQVRRANIAGFGRPVYLTQTATPGVTYDTTDPSPVLMNGDRGPKVADIQRQLHKRRYLELPSDVDGIFGLNTDVTLRRMQFEFGLPVTGEVDAATWRALRRVAHGPT